MNIRRHVHGSPILYGDRCRLERDAEGWTATWATGALRWYVTAWGAASGYLEVMGR